MKPDLRANSSDLERARQIAARLEAPPLAGDSDTSGLPRFSLSHGLRRDGAAPEAVAELGLELPPGASWSHIADHCLARTGAAGMVVVDESGFVIASAGHWRDWSEWHLEAVSARLMAVLDQVERLEGPWGTCDSVVLSLGGDFLTGIRVATAVGGLNLALLANQPLPAAVRNALQEQVRRAVTGG